MGDDFQPQDIAIDFDGTLVRPLNPDDPLSDVQLEPGVVDGLMSLKKAGHRLLLYSARTNRAIRQDPYLDPLVRSGAKPLDMAQWQRDSLVAQARYQQMIDFVSKYLSGIFDAIDSGEQGKPTVDLFIDDKARAFRVKNPEKAWKKIRRKYGR